MTEYLVERLIVEVWPVLTMIAARGAKKRAARGGKYDTLGVTD